jgi:hypothetical protein
MSEENREEAAHPLIAALMCLPTMVRRGAFRVPDGTTERRAVVRGRGYSPRTGNDLSMDTISPLPALTQDVVRVGGGSGAIWNGPSTSPLEPMISRDTLVSFFADTRRLRHNGKVHFDVDGVCRWSFFFVDPSRSKLEPLAGHLQQLGYEVKGFLEPDSSNDRPVYFLRVDRIECHPSIALKHEMASSTS